MSKEDWRHECWLLYLWETTPAKNIGVYMNPFPKVMEDMEEIRYFLGRLKRPRRDADIYCLRYLHYVSVIKLAEVYKITVQRVRQILDSITNELMEYVKR